MERGNYCWELLKACIGTIYIPQVGEIVYYFPKGHREQFGEASIELPTNLPSKIVCRVNDIQLLPEKDTDDVLAQISLSRQADGPKLAYRIVVPDNPNPSRAKIYLYFKVLTPPDLMRYEINIPKNCAERCFPPLSPQTPTQILNVKDVHGLEWEFKHVLRGNRHFLTRGWSKIVKSKRLVAGDVFVLFRGDVRELSIGVIHLDYINSSMPLSDDVFSDLLAQSPSFVVKYKPRLGQCIVTEKRYVEARDNKFSVGMKVKMAYGVVDGTVKGFCGSITKIGDDYPDWRCMEIEWDDHQTIKMGTLMRKDISPWEIEKATNDSVGLKGKRKLEVYSQKNTFEEAPMVVGTVTRHVGSSTILFNTPQSQQYLGGSCSHGGTSNFLGDVANIALQPSHPPPPDTLKNLREEESSHQLPSPETSFDYLAWINDMDFGDEDDAVISIPSGDYTVPKWTVPTIEKINALYPNMLPSMRINDNELKKSYLRLLATLVRSLESFTLGSNSQNEVIEFQKTINDLKSSGIQLDWIERRVQDIQSIISKVAQVNQEKEMANARCKELDEEHENLVTQLQSMSSLIAIDSLSGETDL